MTRTIMMAKMVEVVAMMMVRYCRSADLWIPAWAQRLYCCCGGIVGAGCRLILLILL